MTSNAEAAARAWAREWAFLRAANERGQTVATLKLDLSRMPKRPKPPKAAAPPTTPPPVPPEGSGSPGGRRASLIGGGEIGLAASGATPLATPNASPAGARWKAAAAKARAAGSASPAGMRPPPTPVWQEPEEAVKPEEEAPAAAVVESSPSDVPQVTPLEVVATLEPPTYQAVAERVVRGGKPLIVRLGAELDSEQTGVIMPGGRVMIVETRSTADGSLRAFVLVDGSQAVRPSSPRGSPRYQRSPRALSPRARAGGGLSSPPCIRPPVPPGSWVDDGQWAAAADDPELWPVTFRDGEMARETLSPLLSVPSTSRDSLLMSERFERFDHEGNSDLPGSGVQSAFRRTAPASSTAFSGDLEATVEAHTTDVLSATHGWVTATRNGHELLARVHDGIDASQRQSFITLWDRRKAADKLHAKQTTVSHAEGEKGDKVAYLSAQAKAELKAGPSCAHELVSDPAGIGFAFGGMDPGTLHAHGQVVKAHTVRYSVGLAGKYWLHVGLRQQEERLPGSPFLLEVSPSVAHARSSHLPKERLPLVGIVGNSQAGDVSCSMEIGLCDRMGNSCTRGGATLQLNTTRRGSEGGKAKESGSASQVKTTCTDLENGKYRLEWISAVAGLYLVAVCIGNVHLVGSPFELTLQAGPPDVDKIQVSGDGIESAQAGRPALVLLYCKDEFENVANHMEGISFGLKLLPRDSKDDRNTIDSMKFDSVFVDEQCGTLLPPPAPQISATSFSLALLELL